MEAAFTIGGGGLHLRKYRTDDGASGIPLAAGIPIVSDEASTASQGVLMGTTTAAVSMLGLSLDAPDASTAAQVASGAGYLNDGINATYVTTVINPDLVMRAKLNEGATEDTALVVCSAAQVANAAGTTITSAPDNSTVWGYSGANAGQVRFTSAANTLVVAMPYDIAALDEFLFAELGIGWIAGPTLTTLLTQVDANTAGTAQDNFFVVDFELRDNTEDGKNNSFVLMVACDHAFGCPGIVA
jgi:hypothetical protein